MISVNAGYPGFSSLLLISDTSIKYPPDHLLNRDKNAISTTPILYRHVLQKSATDCSTLSCGDDCVHNKSSSDSSAPIRSEPELLHVLSSYVE